MASQDARLSKFKADFKHQQSKMTNKIDTVLKAITDRMAGALPSDMVKNPNFHDDKPREDEQKEEGSLKNTNIIKRKEEQRETPQLELKGPTDIDEIRPSRNNKEKESELLDIEEPLDLVDTCEELVYETFIKEIPKCSMNYDFRIKKGDPRNLKISCMIGYKFTANAYTDVDLPMNIMSLAYYNSIRKSGYECRERNSVGLGRDMHVFVGNMSYGMYFTILGNIETNIDPSWSHVVFGRPFVKIACLAINRKHGLMTFTDGIKEITFKPPYQDPERSELSSEGHDLLSSRIILSEDDYDRGCRKPSDLEDGFYKDTIKLGPEYLTGIADEEKVT
nr:protein kinase-like domain, concanavalin A-like lectin/glucanase domain protein [Tanacetum cinerariifolium]